MQNQNQLKNYTIYKIVCKNPLITDVYVGKTLNFYMRKAEHKSRCNNPNDKEYNKKVYQFIRNNGGFTNFEIKKVKTYEQIDNKKSSEKENYWFKKLNATLNKQVPNQNLTNREYYVLNRDALLLKKNQKHNCACGGHYTTTHKATHLKTKKHNKFTVNLNINININE